MTRSVLNVQMVLESLTCERSDDWWKGSDPYLWVVFFKIDGATVRVLPTTRLSGVGSIVASNGRHENLGVVDMESGSVVDIPSTIGSHETSLIPIPVDPPLSSSVPDVAGVVGAAVILWEQDDFPDEAAEVGYRELVESIDWAVQELIAQRSLASPEPTDAELLALQDGVNERVRWAIERYLKFHRWLGNPDDLIGFELFRFSHDSFATAPHQELSKRWSGSDGDWVLRGSVIGVPNCPVEAIMGALGERATGLPGAVELQAAMRLFRDAVFPNNPRLAAWWGILQDQSASLARAVGASAELQGSLLELFADARMLLSDPGARIDAGVVRRVEAAMRGLGDAGGPRLRRALSKLRPFLAQLEGRTLMELAASIDRVEPT